MNVRRITFAVGGEPIIGHLHSPVSAGPHPAVVVAGPMTSVKEQVTGVYAAALAERGIAALAIDHRHYGESGGEPRGLEHWQRKVEDLRAALDWLSAQPDIAADRIGGAGVCLGCGYMAHAAADHPRVRALGFVAGYYRNPQAMRASDPAGFDAKVAQGRAAREAFETSGQLQVIPAAATEGDAAMSTPDTVDYYTRRAAHPNYQNTFAVMSREQFLPFDVQAAASRLRVSTLMVHSEKALSPAWARDFARQVGQLAHVEWVNSAGQTDFYDDPALVAKAAGLLAMHFRNTL